MRVEQVVWNAGEARQALAACSAIAPHLVLVFGSTDRLGEAGCHASLREAFPSAMLAGCSTAGEIVREGTRQGSVCITAIRFDAPAITSAVTRLAGVQDSRDAGRRLGEALSNPSLAHVLVFAQGVDINGSALIDALQSAVGESVTIAGGLAGDGAAFHRTLVVCDEGILSDRVVAIGFRGDRVRMAHGSFGGWKPFGPTRRVTRAEGSVLLELDGKPALDVYRTYLGEHARDLPASGLLFPFSMLDADRRPLGVIRTILGIDDARGALVLAGDVRADGFLQLMHASTDALVDGAASAADRVRELLAGESPTLAILVSCVGRRIVMGDRVDEEVEAVADSLGADTTLAGFYSYGEISPLPASRACGLHNQTMTITGLREIA